MRFFLFSDVTLWLRKFLCSCTTFPTVTAALNGRMSCFEFPLRGSVRGQAPWQSSPATRRILSATKQDLWHSIGDEVWELGMGRNLTHCPVLEPDPQGFYHPQTAQDLECRIGFP
ncbi:hypothetical protein PAMA_006639 [Pampus argenteus]